LCGFKKGDEYLDAMKFVIKERNKPKKNIVSVGERRKEVEGAIRIVEEEKGSVGTQVLKVLGIVDDFRRYFEMEMWSVLDLREN
jgi:hypothetical protein